MTGHIVGIDPGARTTGVIIRQGNTLSSKALFTRANSESIEAYAVTTAEWLTEYLGCFPITAIRIEQVVHPKGFNRHGKQRSLNPGHVTDTALVAGHIVGYLTPTYKGRITWVAPGGHGSPPSNLLRGSALNTYMTKAYPQPLHPDRITSTCAWTDERRHLRSAWDISTAPPTMHLTEAP